MAITNQVDQIESRHEEIKTILQNLTYDQIDTYIDNNVTNLANAKEYLKKLSKIVLYLERKQEKIRGVL